MFQPEFPGTFGTFRIFFKPNPLSFSLRFFQDFIFFTNPAQKVYKTYPRIRNSKRLTNSNLGVLAKDLCPRATSTDILMAGLSSVQLG
jgi:hypothetical protein